jgi:F-type H+-transporting ATPase subunit c
MRKIQYVFMALAALCFAIPAFADGGSTAINLVPIGAGIGMALAAGLCGLGQGKATAPASSFCWFSAWPSSSPSPCSPWS